jgi:vacuolar iron transporter family protein
MAASFSRAGAGFNHGVGQHQGVHSRSPADLRRWRRRLADEHAEAKVYRDLAARRTGEEREILVGLAEAEERHAAHWEQLLGADAGRVPRSNLRSRVLAFLARRFGSVFVLALVQQAERRSPYDTDLEATRTMAADERVHEEVVRGLAARGRARVSGSFRAAVFGANDGLVSNLALVLGVAGGGAGTATVLLTGLSGLLSGALSMGAGEYISVRSQRELLAASTPHTADAPQVLPHLDVDANELALVYRARGIPADEAQRRAAALLADTGAAVDVPQDEAGDVVGSGWGAATSSFAFFASGAAVPVLPFLVGLQGTSALLVAGVLVGTALMATGATVGVLSGGPPLRRALRQLAIGAGAAAITYGLGSLVGAVLA